MRLVRVKCIAVGTTIAVSERNTVFCVRRTAYFCQQLDLPCS